MTAPTLGEQLDAMGLHLDVEEGHRITEATLTLVTGDENATWQHQPVSLPLQEPGTVPVPNPHTRQVVTVVSQGQNLSDEQRQRIIAWLSANGVDALQLTGDAITVESLTNGEREWGHRIHFTEYYRDRDGHRTMDWATKHALSFPRCVKQTSPLPGEPTEAAE